VRDEEPLLHLIADLERVAQDADLPRTLRIKAAIGLERMADVLAAYRKGNDLLVEELVLGTRRSDGTRRADGINQILPYWARGTATLEALRGSVVVDESVQPVSVTVHWDRVPPKLRRAAASLASELVDAYSGRLRGGRPRRSKGTGARN
jgi:hypothetical protein